MTHFNSKAMPTNDTIDNTRLGWIGNMLYNLYYVNDNPWYGCTYAIHWNVTCQYAIAIQKVTFEGQTIITGIETGNKMKWNRIMKNINNASYSKPYKSYTYLVWQCLILFSLTVDVTVSYTLFLLVPYITV